MPTQTQKLIMTWLRNQTFLQHIQTQELIQPWLQHLPNQQHIQTPKFIAPWLQNGATTSYIAASLNNNQLFNNISKTEVDATLAATSNQSTTSTNTDIDSSLTGQQPIQQI